VGCHFVLCSSNFDVKICTKKVKLYYKWDKSGIPLDTLSDTFIRNVPFYFIFVHIDLLKTIFLVTIAFVELIRLLIMGLSYLVSCVTCM
jgi:hypothetical protein